MNANLDLLAWAQQSRTLSAANSFIRDRKTSDGAAIMSVGWSEDWAEPEKIRVRKG